MSESRPAQDVGADRCVGCGRDGGKDRQHPDGLYCDICWHGEEGLEIVRLRAALREARDPARLLTDIEYAERWPDDVAREALNGGTDEA